MLVKVTIKDTYTDDISETEDKPAGFWKRSKVETVKKDATPAVATLCGPLSTLFCGTTKDGRTIVEYLEGPSFAFNK